MAQHDYGIANQSGASFRADLNNALAAIVSNNSGASAPSTTYAYQWWADTTDAQLKLRNAANDGWIVIQELDGTMLMEDGTAGSPGLAFASDLDTGFFSAGANALGIATNGVERVEFGTTEVVFNDGGNDIDFRVEGNTNANLFFVDAGNDRVGIGGNPPTSGAIGVVGSAGGVALALSDNTNSSLYVRTASGGAILGTDAGGVIRFATGGNTASEERARIDSSGRVLVGTDASSNIAALTPQVFIEGLSANTSTLAIKANTDDTLGSFLALGKSRGTVDGANTIVQNGDTLGEIRFAGADGTDLASEGARIQAVVDNAPGANDLPTRLVFSTCADGASSPTERLRITSDGTLQLRSSPGIDFSQIQTETAATGAAMTSEVLDSYEEGTWTPYFTSSGATTPFESDITSAYARQNGRYTKIGRQVFFEAWLQTAATWNYQNGGANGQDLGIAGLPFVQNNAAVYAPISVGYFANWSTSWPASYTPMGYVENNTSHIRLTFAGQASVDQIITTNIAVANSDIIFTGVYTVA